MDKAAEPTGPGDARSGVGARLQSLLDIARVVGAVGRFDDLIELTAEEARRALGAASVSISRWDRESGLLRTLVNVGRLGPGEARFPENETYQVSLRPQAYALLEDRRAWVATPDDGSEEGGLLRALGKDSAVAVPIVVEARVWGEMFATREPGQPLFSVADLDFANAVATQLAAGVVQADQLARIERLAFQDPLTGLANRRAVDERLEAALEDHRSRGVSVSLVLADMNGLKQVNDTFGHEAGDRLISAVADCVSRASGLAPGSLAARIGGDEFCVVVSGAPLPVALAVADELCRLVARQPMSTGVSCGVASTDLLPAPLEGSVPLFRLADAAQYRAKRSGALEPVVAGQASTDPVGEPPADRRHRRGRLAVDVQATVESGLDLVDRMVGRDVRSRVEAVAGYLLGVVDAAAWWVSYVAPGSRSLVGVSSSVHRLGEELDEQGIAEAAAGAVFDLDEYPLTDRALRRADSFRLELGQPDNDPAEEASLVTAGYSGVLAAGAAGPDGGWFVEIYTDSISLPSAGLEPVLRALLAVAVAGAAPPPATAWAVPGQGGAVTADLLGG